MRPLYLYVYLIHQWGGYGKYVVGVVWDDADEALQFISHRGYYTLLYQVVVPFGSELGVVFEGGYNE